MPKTRRRGRVRGADVLLTASFYAVFLVQLIHHNLWRDELNAFGLALASPTLGSLFGHIRYEGHPWLWYFLLWTLGRFTTSTVSIKALEACIVGASYGLLGLCSPFSTREKTLWFLGYFVSFEYAVLSRMYSLSLLFLLVYIWRRRARPDQVTANCLLLALLPSTDVMGLLLSLGLLAEYGLARYRSRAKDFRTLRRDFLYGSAAYAPIAGFAVWSARPAPDMGWRTTGHPFTYASSGIHLIASAASFVVMPFLPVGFGHLAPSFWNPNLSHHPGLYLACLPLVLLAYYGSFRKRGELLLLISATLLLSTAFGHLIFGGTMRHWGVTFLSFLAALWLLKQDGKPLPLPALLLLGASALSGIYTGYAQWRRPFSNAESAAAWLRANHLENAPIAGTPDTTVASLAVLLHRPVYMLECNCEDSFVLFSSRRDGFDRKQIAVRLASARKSYASGSLLYVDAYPLSPEDHDALLHDGLTLTELSRFTGATFAEEDFFIYQVVMP